MKALLLDCFGVLVGSGLEVGFERLGGDLAQHRKEIDYLFELYDAGQISFQEEHQRIAQLLGVNYSDWVREMYSGERINNRLFEYVAKWQGKKAVVTNLGIESFRRLSQDIDFSMFDALIVSGQIGVTKPNPVIYYHAAQQLGVAEKECIFVDDSEYNVKGAEAVGMTGILYKGFDQFKKELEVLVGDEMRNN